MNKYKTLYKWMILPFIIMQVGIYKDYWGDFFDNAWSVHIHYWTGTIWYIYLVVQPYFATHNQMSRHRTNGIIGMALAGGVCLTALSIMGRDIDTTQKALESPELFGPFQPWFFFGVIVVEIAMMTAFGYAIVMSIIKRKEIENHAWWLISTVFIIMMPALGRGIQNIYIGIYSSNWPNINIMIPIYITQILIMVMILLAAWKYDKFKHPATILAISISLFIFFIEPIGKSANVQHFLKTIIKR
jgi:F0F1-type ATP synthase membrane subunit c/vacuolar-type H+-ATPase subunit K